MRVFVLLDILALIVFVWLMANILRYLFFKEHGGGGLFFGLSNQWLGGEKKRSKRAKPEEFKAEESDEEKKQ